ncbi:aldolase/citrate lyase family protein [Rhodococcus opacus]|uniref:aldolase/citrate lyase family protein n=1 Tax=Rhodococcus opacus TaxID=37919 RepID=UPI0029554248|nr:aldolase/citrate lyase family protein [Rhodococcus opacus]MDV7090792.1 aldolase/citrate lyase family protein [Rhodococcus opacus]WKN60214.1 aldolase/citrate lyase family protein [Rhodococcus opacus]
MRPLRSLLFIPGHNGSWVEKGVNSGADALILDLEDAVLDDEKAHVPEEVVRSVRRLRESREQIAISIRLIHWTRASPATT